MEKSNNGENLKFWDLEKAARFTKLWIIQMEIFLQ
jgi:hypothetical protein